MVKILDASALMAYLEKESGYEKVKDLLVKSSEGDQSLLMASVNAGEVYYVLIKEHGLEQADRIFHLIGKFPITFVPADWHIAKQAALFKAAKKLPFADCFAAALAKLRHGELVTADKDFKAVEDEVKIVWL